MPPKTNQQQRAPSRGISTRSINRQTNEKTKQLLITDTLKKKSKRHVQTQDQPQQSENQKMKSQTNTKKRKRSEFEQSQSNSASYHQQHEEESKVLKRGAKTIQDTKSKAAPTTKVLDDLENITQQNNIKRFKKNENEKERGNNQIYEIKKQAQITAQQTRGNNLGVRQVKFTYEKPVENIEHQQIIDSNQSKRRGRPLSKKPRADTEIEESKEEAKSVQRTDTLSSKLDLTLPIDEADHGEGQIKRKQAANRRNKSQAASNSAKEVQKEAEFIEESIRDQETLSHFENLNRYNLNRSLPQQDTVHDEHLQLLAVIRYKSNLDQQMVTHKSMLTTLISEDDQKDQEEFEEAVDFLRQNVEYVKYHDFMQRRKKTVSNKLLASDAMIDIYKIWEPNRKKAEKAKQEMKDKL